MATSGQTRRAVARAIGRSERFVYDVLNGVAPGERLLERIEAWLSERGGRPGLSGPDARERCGVEVVREP